MQHDAMRLSASLLLSCTPAIIQRATKSQTLQEQEKLKREVMRHMLFRQKALPDVPVPRNDLTKLILASYKDTKKGNMGNAIIALAQQAFSKVMGLEMRELKVAPVTKGKSKLAGQTPGCSPQPTCHSSKVNAALARHSGGPHCTTSLPLLLSAVRIINPTWPLKQLGSTTCIELDTISTHDPWQDTSSLSKLAEYSCVRMPPCLLLAFSCCWLQTAQLGWCKPVTGNIAKSKAAGSKLC